MIKRRVSYLNGNLDEIKYDLIEYDNGHVKKYNNGYFESFRKTSFDPGELTFTIANGIGYARFTNFGIGIKATELIEISGTAQNSGIAWLASPAISAGMDAINGYIVQIGSDNQRYTTLRIEVTGKWK